MKIFEAQPERPAHRGDQVNQVHLDGDRAGLRRRDQRHAGRGTDGQRRRRDARVDGLFRDPYPAGLAELIFGLNAERGATLFLVTHEDSLAQRCGRVLRMTDVIGCSRPLIKNQQEWMHRP